MPAKTLVFDSDRLFAIARAYSARATEAPHETIAAVILSAAALEGFVNELAEWAMWNSDGRAPDVISSFAEIMTEAETGRAQLPLKIQLISGLFAGKPFPRGSAVYQDFDLLLRLRNAIVHLKPEKRTSEEPEASSHSKLVQRLKARRLLPPGQIEFPWLDAASNPLVAAWSYRAVEVMTVELIKLIPQSPFRLQILARSRILLGERFKDEPSTGGP